MKSKLNNSIRFILLILYGFIAFLFLIAGIGLIINHYFIISPSKISIEFESTLLYSVISLNAFTIFLILFYLLLKEKKEVILLFFIVFLIVLTLSIIFAFEIEWNNFIQVFMTISLFLLPGLNLFYLIKRYTKVL